MGRDLPAGKGRTCEERDGMGDYCKRDRGDEQAVRLQMTKILRLQNVQRFMNGLALMYDVWVWYL